MAVSGLTFLSVDLFIVKGGGDAVKSVVQSTSFRLLLCGFSCFKFSVTFGAGEISIGLKAFANGVLNRRLSRFWSNSASSRNGAIELRVGGSL
jgi:hypothetical protein